MVSNPVSDEEIQKTVAEMDWDENDIVLEEDKEFQELKKQQDNEAKSMLAKLGIVTDDTRAKFLTQKTPKSAIYTRQGKAGQKWRYIKGEYVKTVLNTVFAFQWDFELMPLKDGELFFMNAKQVIVVGKLTIRDTHGTARIIKTATGKKDIAYSKNKDGGLSTIPLDFGNDIKAAETDALKRCANHLGIGLDLYRDEERDKSE